MSLISLLSHGPWPHPARHKKYHVLLGYLKVDQAKRLALAYVHTPQPYNQAIRALDERCGQPRQLALRELPSYSWYASSSSSRWSSSRSVSLCVQALVLLKSMGCDGLSELTCGSHVNRLLEKLPSEQFGEFKKSMKRANQGPFSCYLLDFSSYKLNLAASQRDFVCLQLIDKGRHLIQSKLQQFFMVLRILRKEIFLKLE